MASILAFGGGAIDEGAAAAAFVRLDIDGDGFVDHGEMLQIIHQYFTSDDPQAPGNWLIGPWE